MPNLYVATNGLSVWSCDKLGDTLSRMSTGAGMYSGSQVWALSSHPSRPGELLAGTDSGLYRLDTKTQKWTHVSSPMDSIQITAIGQAADNPDVIICGTQPSALYRTKDGGKTWCKLDIPLKEYETSGFYAGERAKTAIQETAIAGVKHWMRVTDILFDPKNSQTVWVGIEIDGAWVSHDGGDHWERITNGQPNQDIHGICLLDSGRMFMTCPIGLYVSEDRDRSFALKKLRSAWQHTRSVVERQDHTGVMFLTNGDFPPGRNGQLFRSRNHGKDWEDVGLPGPVESAVFWMAVHPSNPDLMFAAATLGQIYRSMDGGEVWTPLGRRLPEIRDIAWLPD